MALTPKQIAEIEASLVLPFDEFTAKYVLPAFEALKQDNELAEWQRREHQ